MKIIHCLFTMRTGGAQVLVVDMLNEMCLHNEVILIIVNRDYNKELLQELNSNITIYYINRKEGSKDPFPVLRFNLLLYRLRPDIIHCHERKMIQLIKYKGARTVYTIHDTSIPTDTFHQYDALVAISTSVATDVRNRSDLSVDTIINGVPIQKFVRRTAYTISSQPILRLVQVSRLVHEKKGQDILIQALARLVYDDHETNLRLDFIGEGESKNYLISLTKSLNLDALITFCGEQDRNQIAKNLSTYHILVQPSRFEGFGLTVVEGFSAGLPVVASNIDGPAEIMHNLPAGYLFTHESVEDCTDALRRVICAYRHNQIEKAVKETYAYIEKRFSIQETTNNYLSIYKRLTVVKTASVQHPVLINESV